jgi:V/A-type H+/Na+-transporting ATPase subunit F
MTKDLAVLGSEEFVIGFRLAGVGRATIAEGSEFEPAMEKLLAAGDVGILVVPAEETAKLSASTRRRLAETIDPVVIQIGEASEDDLREKVKRAIGIDLYK